MGIARAQRQVVWSAAATKSVAFGATETSDAFTLDATTIDAEISFKAKNNGAPASGDTVDFFLVRSSGDTDAAGGTDEYDTVRLHLGRLNTHSGSGGSDPAQKTVTIPSSHKNAKIVAVNNSGGRAITVSALITEKTAS